MPPGWVTGKYHIGGGTCRASGANFITRTGSTGPRRWVVDFGRSATMRIEPQSDGTFLATGVKPVAQRQFDEALSCFPCRRGRLDSRPAADAVLSFKASQEVKILMDNSIYDNIRQPIRQTLEPHLLSELFS